MARRLYIFPATLKAIGAILHDKYDQFINSNAFERGELIGEATVMIAGLLIPGSDLAAIAETSTMLRTGIAISMAEVAADTALLGQQAANAIRVATLTKGLALTGARAEEFAVWAGEHFSGADANRLTAAFANVRPARVEFLQKVMAGLGEGVSEQAKGYLIGVVAYEQKIFGAALGEAQALHLVHLYDEVAAKLAAPVTTRSEIEITRAIGKTWRDSEGVVHMNNSSDVMLQHGGGTFESHRFARPSVEGFHAATGDLAFETAKAEVRTTDSVLVETATVIVERPLYLTNPRVIASLGVQIEELLIKISANNHAYDVTQLIGEIARSKGYDAILYPSAQVEGGTSILLFKARFKP